VASGGAYQSMIDRSSVLTEGERGVGFAYAVAVLQRDVELLHGYQSAGGIDRPQGAVVLQPRDARVQAHGSS
jgi:hypothetical protein